MTTEQKYIILQEMLRVKELYIEFLKSEISKRAQMQVDADARKAEYEKRIQELDLKLQG